MTRIQRLFPVVTLLLFLSSHSTASPASVGFYYGSEAPIGRLMAYDWLVLQQSQTGTARTDLLARAGTTPIAYISVGELARSHRLFKSLPPEWVIGKNPAWASVVLDLRLPDVRNFLLEKLIDPAFDKGFQGVFLDTLDSFLLAADGEQQTADFARAQQALISAIRERHPDARIILNRGFHLPDAVIPQIDALALESWRNGYNAEKKKYVEVSEQDRQWLNGQLDRWRDARPDLPLIAIDYVADLSRAGALAIELESEGFVPWVGNPELNWLGPSQPAKTVNRHLLVIHDLPESRMDFSAAHRYGGIVMERLGLVPSYRSTQQPLPSEPTVDRYAGILVWWETGDRHSGFCQWLSQQQAKGLPVVLIGQTPDSPACLNVIGASRNALPMAPLDYQPQHPSMAAYEGQRLPAIAARRLPIADDVTPWLTATDDQGERFSPVYTHAGGGVAAHPYLFETAPDDQVFWLFDPFAFLTSALKLPPFPAIDSTTESGRQILTAHIDGDGLVSRAELPGSPLSATVIQRDILQRFNLPHTVSVIEAETSPQGLYPSLSGEAEAIARNIFAMNSVEVASHSYSHPFFWGAMEGGPAPRLENTLYGYFMDIPDYQASLAREIGGSVAYINRRLAPADKPVSVFLWTGDARPGDEALRRVREAGLINVNGGNTKPVPYASELAGTWPDARPVGDELQVYAPVMNENVYTNQWTGPYYGFRNVIDTFRILEDKGRLKPMGIYYHFYSGTKPAALSALTDIYTFALRQSVTPLFLSQYAERVQTQYYSALQRTEDGGWQWRGIDQPSTVKIALDQFPDLARSTGVAGYRDQAGQRYVHLTGNSRRLYLSDQPVGGPYLSHANAVLDDWNRQKTASGWRLTVSFTGHQPIELTLAGTTNCTSPNDSASIRQAQGLVTVSLPASRIEALALECR